MILHCKKFIAVNASLLIFVIPANHKWSIIVLSTALIKVDRHAAYMSGWPCIGPFLSVLAYVVLAKCPRCRF
jgi:hypothetical protein